ncbi:lachesin [Trichonephila inaurata madagascariensis]|uniref:Lachesin n=1 Tax=Trichonephila inaurata madagascariensis TaxID=2747483 RepID=A0A8X6YV29_9ARAC|nr:lachesin [Trichonephila inaurata madagascariensis]
MLACDAGDDGGLPQTFHMEVYSMMAEQLIMNLTTTESPVFVAEKLSSSSSYLLVLYASNPKGRSMSVALTARTLFAAEPRTITFSFRSKAETLLAADLIDLGS